VETQKGGEAYKTLPLGTERWDYREKHKEGKRKEFPSKANWKGGDERRERHSVEGSKGVSFIRKKMPKKKGRGGLTEGGQTNGSGR